jgi:hypothetical protein
MARRHSHRDFLLSAGFLLIAGCSSNEDMWTKMRPKVVPATGTVLYKGAPVADATVTFNNKDVGRSAFAKTDANGVFRLTTFKEGDGAAPGQQQVTVRKTELIPGKSLPPADASESMYPPIVLPERWLIPQRYSHPESSELTVEVVAGGENEFVLKLED